MCGRAVGSSSSRTLRSPSGPKAVHPAIVGWAVISSAGAPVGGPVLFWPASVLGDGLARIVLGASCPGVQIASQFAGVHQPDLDCSVGNPGGSRSRGSGQWARPFSDRL
jgi:hypothetical protein